MALIRSILHLLVMVVTVVPYTLGILLVRVLGGSPAGKIGEWRIDLPAPREDHLAELGHIRIEIVGTLRSATRRH